MLAGEGVELLATEMISHRACAYMGARQARCRHAGESGMTNRPALSLHALPPPLMRAGRRALRDEMPPLYAAARRYNATAFSASGRRQPSPGRSSAAAIYGERSSPRFLLLRVSHAFKSGGCLPDIERKKIAPVLLPSNLRARFCPPVPYIFTDSRLLIIMKECAFINYFTKLGVSRRCEFEAMKMYSGDAIYLVIREKCYALRYG